LHYYGINILISLLFLKASDKNLLSFILFVIVTSYTILLRIDYFENWNLETLDYINFWTLSGFTTNLFINGFHPVFPWIAFMLFGVFLGRKDLLSNKFNKYNMIVSFSIFILINLISPISSLNLSTNPMPPNPFYMINGISFASFMISLIIVISQKMNSNLILRY